jgi:hypothetical protein
METGDEFEKFVDAFDEHCTPSLVLQDYPSQDELQDQRGEDRHPCILT